MHDLIQTEFLEHIQTTQETLAHLAPTLAFSGDLLLDTLKKGNKILICGNGGSAADSQHFAAELTGRYKRERQGLPAVALSTDTSALTAIANDYGYDRVFARQVEALGRAGDCLVGISTSGNSANVLLALKKAQEMDLSTLGLSGRGGGAMRALCTHNLIVPSANTPRIQEMHILMIHLLCDFVEKGFC
ncbi:D-sedoheptulose 7-phosphate isomerase [Helicobacter ailurogastricus]|uniref:Phosphoheptose isomerase n=1 Tax=Helicobacter ailurogastricus TaxID=1578720 RepID=A0A0K2X3T7_9HELI|nr:D-sedoheptulose 7-phosphate isomerase [Helicobacter ailurogastricus]CRF40902.1 Phosphoheptose isomerase 1 [Helicobacter ailurogastricus]CRF42127.1 Phosphoheptose isomerase 1 [Helicobacter ailurogastricus]CRF44691.1 Phosphoheptose isomerase 1 [Helicobacter ailurogastricus]CRI32227.1 Phosphoheptose isomerase 1 [Helicobacter ailurogastricus]BDQ28702.1 phosphoheptose isomerase [Helicobacter ailurogastricus]